MKDLQMHLEKIRTDAAECRFLSTLAADGKSELLARLAENLNALTLDVEETIATNDERAARSRRMLRWWLAIVLVTIAGAAFFWANNGAEEHSSLAIVQSKPEPSPAPQDHGEQAMGVLLSSYQGERKVLTEQLGALAARVDILERALDNLERARAETARQSNKQSVGSEDNPTATEIKPSAPEEKPSALEEKPVRTEEKRTSTLEKPAAAEENADAKQPDGVPPGIGNPFIEPVDQVGAIPVPKQAELDPRKPAIGPPGCMHFRSFDPRASTDGGASAGSAR